MENSLLPLNDTTLNLLKQKHPLQSEADKHLLFDDISKSIHKIKHECIDAEVIRNAFRYGCRWLEENTHIQQFWSEFHQHMYDPGQFCKEVMCRTRSNQLR